jgi:hypothetical protein
MNFSEMIGQNINAVIPYFGSSTLQPLKLHGVEAGGLWLESQKATNDFLTKIGAQTVPKTLVFFVPYNQIVFVLGSVEAPSLNEKSFDVQHSNSIRHSKVMQIRFLLSRPP